MTTPEQWNRTYGELTSDDFVRVPGYDLQKLVVPMQSLLDPRNIPEITRKLYYSTRYFGSYDIDKGEFSGDHPGVDLKLALGQPVGAIAGGRVYAVENSGGLGLHVIIEHRHPTDGVFYSVYGHLGSTRVSEGATVTPGQTIGTVGMTGNTSGPHLHLQVDLQNGEPHSPATAQAQSVNPITFIGRYAGGE